jgi:hypothetical protein
MSFETPSIIVPKAEKESVFTDDEAYKEQLKNCRNFRDVISALGQHGFVPDSGNESMVSTGDPKDDKSRQVRRIAQTRESIISLVKSHENPDEIKFMDNILPRSIMDQIGSEGVRKIWEDAFAVEGEGLAEQIGAAQSLPRLISLFIFKKGIRASTGDVIPGETITEILRDLAEGKGKYSLLNLTRTCGLRSKAEALLKMKKPETVATDPNEPEPAGKDRMVMIQTKDGLVGGRLVSRFGSRVVIDTPKGRIEVTDEIAEADNRKRERDEEDEWYDNSAKNSNTMTIGQ